jgi:hypothetical protein
VCTAADPKSACPRAESSRFQKKKIDFPPAKRVLSTRSSKSTEIYPIKTCFVFKRVRICIFLRAAHTAWNPPSLDMQLFPHIHAPHEPTYSLVVVLHDTTRSRSTAVVRQQPSRAEGQQRPCDEQLALRLSETQTHTLLEVWSLARWRCVGEKLWRSEQPTAQAGTECIRAASWRTWEAVLGEVAIVTAEEEAVRAREARHA